LLSQHGIGGDQLPLALAVEHPIEQAPLPERRQDGLHQLCGLDALRARDLARRVSQEGAIALRLGEEIARLAELPLRARQAVDEMLHQRLALRRRQVRRSPVGEALFPATMLPRRRAAHLITPSS
jgi:hypothetical protein